VCADILEGLSLSDWRKLLPTNFVRECFDAIVTVFALHHYTAKEKGIMYKRFADALCPNGLFLNGDLFSYESPLLAKYSQNRGEKWITDQFAAMDAETRPPIGTVQKTFVDICQQWIEHLRTHNIPLPLEHGWAQNPMTMPKLIEESEVQLLKIAGFSEIGCPYRYFQAGIAWARK
jgi:hypothetical protein